MREAEAASMAAFHTQDHSPKILKTVWSRTKLNENATADLLFKLLLCLSHIFCPICPLIGQLTLQQPHLTLRFGLQR
eukprot:SAG31_NODE_41653_length_275_cov_0.585227_1_plen_76_part_01